MTDEKVWCITGPGRGMGEHIAEAYATTDEHRAFTSLVQLGKVLV